MKKNILETTIGLLILMGLGVATVWAADTVQGHGGRMGGPPPEAIEVCKDKSEGNTVEFTNRRGDKIRGTCKLIDNQLVAVPEGGPRRPQGPPPGQSQGGQ